MKSNESKRPSGENQDLRGSFIFVMLLGVFIIASWFAIYGVFISR